LDYRGNLQKEARMDEPVLEVRDRETPSPDRRRAANVPKSKFISAVGAETDTRGACAPQLARLLAALIRIIGGVFPHVFRNFHGTKMRATHRASAFVTMTA
jgi:hypothetical protein